MFHRASLVEPPVTLDSLIRRGWTDWAGPDEDRLALEELAQRGLDRGDIQNA